jgi:predicted HAD superfamily phosphohydrolase YqeG
VRRVRRIPIARIEELAHRAPVATHLVVDVDGTLLPFGRVRASDEAVGRLRDLVGAHRPHTVCVATNARAKVPLSAEYSGIPVTYVTRARKPWTHRRRLDAPCEAPEAACLRAVVGDQVLTDGLLALRLDAVFVHVTSPGAHEPPGSRLMRLVGLLLTPLLFRREAG